MNCSNKSKYVAELIGTFALVFFGCGTAVIAGGEVGFLGISCAFGFTLMALVYAIGPVSGCHVNPAVTIAMLVAGKIKANDAIIYIIVQVIGAIAAAWVIGQVTAGMPELAGKFGQNGFGAGSPGGFGQEAGIIMEVVMTFLFLIVIFGATSVCSSAVSAGIAIGAALFVIHLIGIPVTGTSVNPARSFGPALLAGDLAMDQIWLFVAAPIGGAVLAAFTWNFCCCPKACAVEEEKVVVKKTTASTTTKKKPAKRKTTKKRK